MAANRQRDYTATSELEALGWKGVSLGGSDVVEDSDRAADHLEGFRCMVSTKRRVKGGNLLQPGLASRRLLLHLLRWSPKRRWGREAHPKAEATHRPTARESSPPQVAPTFGQRKLRPCSRGPTEAFPPRPLLPDPHPMRALGRPVPGHPPVVPLGPWVRSG